MGTRAVTSGPVGDRVRHRVATLRRERRLTLAQLSERLGQVGRPILPTGVSKIEAGERRVDVDDLVALALAFDVPPNALLLPADVDPTADVPLTGSVSAPGVDVWLWAIGDSPLPGVGPPSVAPGVWADRDESERRRRFRHESRPRPLPVEYPPTGLAARLDAVERWIQGQENRSPSPQ